MKRIIGVMGGSAASSKEITLAYGIGKVIAKLGAVLLTGGMSGVMEASSKGAHEEKGLVLAICPTSKKEDLNQFVDIGVITGMGGGRNYMNIKTADIVIAIGSHSAGTLSEIAFTIQTKKPLIIVNASKNMKAYLLEFKNENIYFISTVKAVEKKLISFMKKL
jgi:uncharacterized protein (TIGR00725 family)